MPPNAHLFSEYEKEHGLNPVTYVLAEVGGNTGRSLAGSDTKDVDQLGSIAVELIDADSRPYTSFELVAAIQDNVRRHPMLETVSFRGWRSGPGGDSMDIQISGADATTLKRASEALKAAVAQYPEVSAVEDNLAYDKEELVLELTPQGQSLGFTIDAIGRELRSRLNGIEAASFPIGVRTAEITVRLPQEELAADFLADVVSVETKLGFSTVRRENGVPLISVTGDISEDDPDRANFIGEQLRNVIMPQIAADIGIEWRMSGLAEQEQDFLCSAST